MLTNTKPLMKSRAEQETWFEALFLEHYALVVRVLLRLLGDRAEAEDMAQQVFLKLYHNLDRLGRDQDETNVAGWLYRVAVNQGYNALRSRGRRQAWHDELARLWPFGQAPDPARLVESRDAQARVRQILAGMKARDAKLLLLRHAGLSYQELAATLGVAPSSVGPLLTQAKRRFARKYRATFSEEE
jgi:RNA polymerase sigma-70 factor (ECF subfamily)